MIYKIECTIDIRRIYIILYANAEIDKIVNNKHIFITYLCIPYVSLIYSLLIILSNISLASRI